MSYALVFCNGVLRQILREEIEQSPATCALCQQSFFWWRDDAQPQCLYCLPPDAEWREQMLLAADRFIEKAASVNKPAGWMQAIREKALSHGGRNWASVQKLAFSSTVPDLMLQWFEQERSR